MNVTAKFLITAILAASAAPAFAQAAAPAQQALSRTAFMQRIDGAFTSVDANKDGFWDKAEIEAAESKGFAAEKANVVRRREAYFKSLDANKDGNLSLQEFNAKASAATLPKPNGAPVLAKLDTNKDGKISLAVNRAPAMAKFDRADTNKDGTITPAEEKALAAKR
jgi:hypothetical protein